MVLLQCIEDTEGHGLWAGVREIHQVTDAGQELDQRVPCFVPWLINPKGAMIIIEQRIVSKVIRFGIEIFVPEIALSLPLRVAQIWFRVHNSGDNKAADMPKSIVPAENGVPLIDISLEALRVGDLEVDLGESLSLGYLGPKPACQRQAGQTVPRKVAEDGIQKFRRESLKGKSHVCVGSRTGSSI